MKSLFIYYHLMKRKKLFGQPNIYRFDQFVKYINGFTDCKLDC